MLAEDKVFKFAIAISFVLHLIVILPWNLPFFKKDINKISSKKPDIVYTPMQLEESKPVPQKGIKASLKQEEAPPTKEPKKEEKILQGEIDQKIIKVQKENKYTKEDSDVKDEDLGVIGIEQVSAKQRPVFIEYYRFIRNKIEVVAQDNRPGYFKEGEVNIIFKVTSDGRLLDAKINEEESSRDRVLRFSAVDSVEKASPFPPFPKGLSAKELEFRITIEFHI